MAPNKNLSMCFTLFLPWSLWQFSDSWELPGGAAKAFSIHLPSHVSVILVKRSNYSKAHCLIKNTSVMSRHVPSCPVKTRQYPGNVYLPNQEHKRHVPSRHANIQAIFLPYQEHKRHVPSCPVKTRQYPGNVYLPIHNYNIAWYNKYQNPHKITFSLSKGEPNLLINLTYSV